MKNIKVYTVGSLNNVEIEKYIDTVTYHVVIGMNFFADFMQSFTDFFGGNSESYQKRLKEINNSVIEGIKSEVLKSGGNCAIDLKIDNDEISAKGKSMIMVTAIATSVVINSNKLIEIKQNKNANLISNEELKNALLIYRFKTEITENPYFLFKNSVLNDLTENVVYKNISKYIFDSLIKLYEEENKVIDTFTFDGKKILQYFSNSYSDELSKHMYNYVLNTSTSLENKFLNFIYKIIEFNISFNDYNLNLELIKKDDILIHSLGISLNLLDKEYYSEIDFEKLSEAYIYLNNKYTSEIDSTDKWECPNCSKTNRRDKTCINCKTDFMGYNTSNNYFTSSSYFENRIEGILFKINEKLISYKEILKQ